MEVGGMRKRDGKGERGEGMEGRKRWVERRSFNEGWGR